MPNFASVRADKANNLWLLQGPSTFPWRGIMQDLRIVVLDGGTLFPADVPYDRDHPMFRQLEKLGSVDVYESMTPEQVLDRASGYDVVLNNKVLLNAGLLAQLADPANAVPTRLISMLATGYDCTDVCAARNLGIDICNVPVYGTEAVAEYVFNVLHHLHRDTICLYDNISMLKRWAEYGQFSMPRGPLQQLSGQTLGVIGAGRIGCAVIERAMAYNMDVVAFDINPKSLSGVRWAESAEEVLNQSDIITIHANWQRNVSRPLITDQSIKLIKPGATLINAARGQFVELPALKRALKRGTIKQAVLDTLPQGYEPPASAAKLYQLQSLVCAGAYITPHIAWYTKQSLRNLWEQTIENIMAWQSGSPINVVNLQQPNVSAGGNSCYSCHW